MSDLLCTKDSHTKTRNQGDAMTETIALPLDLAPALAERLAQLLSEVSTVSAPDLVLDITYSGSVCVVCHDGGKLGGHHGDDGEIEWIHRSCHRLLHHRGLPRRTELRRLRRLERHALIPC